MTLILDFQGELLKMLYLRNGRSYWRGTKWMWVDRMQDSHCDFKLWPHPWRWPWEGWLTWNERDVSYMWCWMHNGIDMGRAWQIHRPNNGSMWNSYSFSLLPNESFTDLGAEGCCRTLNTLLKLLSAHFSRLLFQFSTVIFRFDNLTLVLTKQWCPRYTHPYIHFNQMGLRQIMYFILYLKKDS